MKQIQKIIKQIFGSGRPVVDKEQKIRQTSHYLAAQRRKLVAEAPIGFKPRSSSDYFLQN